MCIKGISISKCSLYVEANALHKVTGLCTEEGPSPP